MTPEEKAVVEAALAWQREWITPPPYEAAMALHSKVGLLRESRKPRPRYSVMEEVWPPRNSLTWAVLDRNVMIDNPPNPDRIATCYTSFHAERIAQALNEKEERTK